MSHFSFYVPSLPAAHYLFSQIFDAQETRYRLDRESGAEWIDFNFTDWQGENQISVHLDPKAKQFEREYTIEEIRDKELGKAELFNYLQGPLHATANVGNVVAPMPHWGPVFDSRRFDEVIWNLKRAGYDERTIKPQLHHPATDAEHKTAFLKFGDFHFEIKGYTNKKGITAPIPQAKVGRAV